MTYEQMLEKAKEIVNNHNEAVGDGDVKVDWDSFIKKLKASGGTSEGGLSKITWEELQECGLPKLIAKQVAEVFRTKEEASKTGQVTVQAAQDMEIGELLKNYEPGVDDAVSRILMKRSKGRLFIVLEDNGPVDVDASVKLFKEIIEDQDAELPWYRVSNNNGGYDTDVKKVYRVGEQPDAVWSINPLFPNAVLQNGRCDRTGRSWVGVFLCVRQFILLAVLTGEIYVHDIERAHEIIGMATKYKNPNSIPSQAMELLNAKFPQTAELFDKLSEPGTLLPILKMYIPAGRSAAKR